MRRRWILLPVAVTVLAIGVFTAGAILAQGLGTGDGSLALRVATILGLDEAQVQEAIDQARGDMRAEAIRSKLDGLVAEGRITEEQGDEYLVWFESKPADLPGFGPRGRGFGRHHRFGFGHGGLPPVSSSPPDQGS